MNGWKISFLLGWLPGRCYVSFREGKLILQDVRIYIYIHLSMKITPPFREARHWYETPNPFSPGIFHGRWKQQSLEAAGGIIEPQVGYVLVTFVGTKKTKSLATNGLPGYGTSWYSNIQFVSLPKCHPKELGQILESTWCLWLSSDHVVTWALDIPSAPTARSSALPSGSVGPGGTKVSSLKYIKCYQFCQVAY